MGSNHAPPFGCGGKKRLMVPLDLEAVRSLCQPGHLTAQLADDHARQDRSHSHSRKKDQQLQVVADRRPPLRRQDEPDFEDHRSRDEAIPSDSAVTVYKATKSAASATKGPVVDH